MLTPFQISKINCYYCTRQSFKENAIAVKSLPEAQKPFDDGAGGTQIYDTVKADLERSARDST
jgi:hypothetical protein